MDQLVGAKATKSISFEKCGRVSRVNLSEFVDFLIEKRGSRSFPISYVKKSFQISEAKIDQFIGSAINLIKKFVNQLDFQYFHQYYPK